MLHNIKPSEKIYFLNEKLPMEVIVVSERYAVCVRSLDIESDFELLAFEVERGAYYNSQTAYDALKESPIYTLIDFEKQRRGPSNFIFSIYDYWSKDDCQKCLDHLEKGVHEISHRHGIDLNIDWDRTLTQQVKPLK